jgi:serine/threonine protein kinase
MTPERHLKLHEIFEAAVNLAEAERPAYLDQACAGDRGLRDRLNQLLAADDETVLSPMPVSPPAQSAVMECPKCWRCYESPLAACPEDYGILQFAFAGSQLIDGKYLVERRLGRGGMGAVYLAQHIGLEKRFALKLILHEDAMSRAYRESFENEARALGHLKHRNIVDVTDYGVDPRGGGLPYLVMEYLAGKTLSQVLKERSILPFGEAISLLRATADAVDTAHNNNIVHGDLKPSNLFLAEEPDSATPCLKVVDFGLARLANQPSEAGPAASRQRPKRGDIRGTPAYMAPELLRGEGASPASDRFALGALIYEVLAGHPPFGRQVVDVEANIKKPPALLSSTNPALAADIDAPVLALLNPDAERRPPGASAGVSAIAGAWLSAEQRKWRKREWPKRLVLATIATGVVLLISFGLAQIGIVRVLEGRIADQRFALLPQTHPDPSLLLVSIDDATLKADQRPLGERAGEFAAMIDGLFAAGAKAVAVDALLPSRFGESQEFAKAVVSRADRLTLAIFSAPSGEVIGTECLNPLTALTLGQKYTALFGLANLEEDEDGTIRRARLFFLDKSGRRSESFAGRAVEVASPGRRSGAPTAEPIWIDYSVPLRYLTPISWKDVPARLGARPELFRNRLVIVGATFAGSGDERVVPGVASGKMVAGQFVQAWIANTILGGSPIHEVRLLPCLAAVGLACLAATAAALCFPHYYFFSLIGSVILFCVYAAVAFWIFHSSRTMVAVVAPELAALLSLFAAWGLRSVLIPYPAVER